MRILRSWSVRHARWLKRAYGGFEAVLVWSSPLLARIGYDRLDRPFAAMERATKGILLDSQNCGQCIVGFTGLACPMNCPKKLRNGPCGGVRDDGTCEVEPGMTCVWVLAWEGNKRFRENGYPIQQLQPPVDYQLIGKSAWLREVRLKARTNRRPAREV